METTHTPAATTVNDDAQGPFTKNNSGGPGNPCAARVAHLKRVLLASITDEDMEAITDKLIELAKEGSLPAIKLLFAHALGKPGPTSPAEPVQAVPLNRHPSQPHRNTEALQGTTTPVPDLAPDLTPLAGPSLLDELAQQLHGSGRAGEQRPLSRQQRRAERRERQRAEQRRKLADVNG
jgi:hypothetical protein